MEIIKYLKFWCKFIDVDAKGYCDESEYMPLLEELVRGKCLNKKNKSTAMFARDYQTYLREAGCLGE